MEINGDARFLTKSNLFAISMDRKPGNHTLISSRGLINVSNCDQIWRLNLNSNISCHILGSQKFLSYSVQLINVDTLKSPKPASFKRVFGTFQQVLPAKTSNIVKYSDLK